MEPTDFAFIRALAAEIPNFTVPSEFLLWFFSRFHPDYCRVIDQEPGGLKAYLLAMPTSHPPNGLAIWQVAAAESDHAFALEYFAAYLRDLVERSCLTSLSFSMPNNPVSLRLIRSLANKFGNCEIAKLDTVPVGQGEVEFRLSIRLQNRLKD